MWQEGEWICAYVFLISPVDIDGPSLKTLDSELISSFQHVSSLLGAFESNSLRTVTASLCSSMWSSETEEQSTFLSHSHADTHKSSCSSHSSFQRTSGVTEIRPVDRNISLCLSSSGRFVFRTIFMRSHYFHFLSCHLVLGFFLSVHTGIAPVLIRSQEALKEMHFNNKGGISLRIGGLVP